MKEWTVYTNNIYDIDEDYIKEWIVDNEDIEESEITDDKIYDYWYRQIDIEYDDLRRTLKTADTQLENDIVAIADIGRWCGRVCGYKTLDDFTQVVSCFEDYNTLKIDRYNNLTLEAVHHDGTNYITFREFKSDLSDTQIDNFLDKLYNGTATKRDVTRYTKAVGHYINDCYC